MEQLNLRISAKDVINNDARKVYPWILCGYGLTAYFGKVPVSFLLTYGLLLVLAILFVVLIIETNVNYLTLTEEGFIYKHSRLKNIFCQWTDDINIETGNVKKYYCHIITDMNKGNKIYIPVVIFNYPKVQSFISRYAPPGHQFHQFVHEKF